MRICPVGAELLRPDGRTDITKLMVALRIFANTAENLRLKYLWMPSVTFCKYDIENVN